MGFIERVKCFFSPSKIQNELEMYKQYVKNQNDEIEAYKKEKEQCEKQLEKFSTQHKSITEENRRLKKIDKIMFMIATLLGNDEKHEIIMPNDIERMTSGAKICTEYFDADPSKRAKKEQVVDGFMHYLEEELWVKVCGTNFACWEAEECREKEETGDV